MTNNPVYPSSKKALVALLAAFVAAGPALAQDVVKANNTDDLNLTSSWSGGTVPGASNVAVWDNTSTFGSFLLGADLEFHGIRIGNPGGIVTIGAGNILTLGASGIDLVSRNLNIVPQINLSASQEWTIGNGLYLDSNSNANNNGVTVNNQGNDLTINVVSAGLNTSNYVNVYDLAGSGDLIKDGSGRVRFTHFNRNFTGNIILNNGMLHAGFRASALGSGASTLTLNGGQLTFASNVANTDYGRNTTVGGDAEIYNNNSTNNGATGYSFGTLSIGANTLTVNRNSGGTSAGNITFGATTLTGNGTFEVGDHGTNAPALNQLTLGAVGESGGSRDLIKTGGGTLILSGANTYSGTTDVTGGALLINGDHSAATGGISVASGARFGGNGGNLSSDVTFADGAALVFNPNWTFAMDDTSTLSFASTFTPLDLVQADGAAIDWATLDLDTIYTLISGSFTQSGISYDSYDVGGGRQAYFQEGSLQLVVIPEPSTLVLLGVALLSAAFFRKRR